MRSKILTVLVVGASILGTASAAQAAKSKEWLWVAGTSTRAVPGEAATIAVYSEECHSQETASVSSNGKPKDQAVGTGTLAAKCSGSAKLAGEVKSVAIAPVGPGLSGITLTIKSKLYVEVEPWCTYALPGTMVEPAVGYTEASVYTEGKLDRSASFGSCPATLLTFVDVELVQASTGHQYYGLVEA